MIHQLRSEFRKLFSIRSTYVFLFVCLAIDVLFAFYIEGYHSLFNVTSPGKLASEITSAAQSLVFFISLVGVLLVTHEYRYNTIMYTLTASKGRLRILLSKLIVVSVFAIIATLVFATLAPLLTSVGLHLKGLSMVHQVIPIKDLLWRVMFFGWAYAVLGLILSFIIRNQVGSIITLLLFPSAAESLLTLLLKNNAKYLPFTALDNVLGSSDRGPVTAAMSSGKAAQIVCVYLAVGLIVAAVLFKKRDAN